LLGSYASGISSEGAAEIVAHDAGTQRLFVLNAEQSQVDVLDARDPSALTRLGVLDVSGHGPVATSVAVNAGLVAVSVQATLKTDAGSVVFFDAESLAESAVVTVGALPDMVRFSPDGHWLLVANEGEPSDDYAVDPAGSISVIDVSRRRRGHLRPQVRTADFAAFDAVPLDPSIRVFGPGALPSQDFEPEFVTISEDSRLAWVTLQENNAIAVVDIRRARVLRLLALGEKDHSLPGNGLDPSDKDSAIAIGNWPVYGMYLPDAIASYRFKGHTFLVSANEGDVRDWDGYSEEARVKDLTLDAEVFPDAANLQADANLGRLKVTSSRGDRDGDGDFDALYSFGARSFSIRRADGRLVFDSGDDFERITAETYPANFNADHESSAFDARSDDKGPEPEGIAVGSLRGRTYAFIALERVGGIVTYDVTNPYAPCLVSYVNSRDFAAEVGDPAVGDLGPEGLVFIEAKHSPNGRALLVSGNEVSGTTSVYEVSVTRRAF
jgi:DNA-binding beta-propeller fold protein YncE